MLTKSKRYLRRRGYWILTLGILAAIVLWRATPRTITIPPIVELPKQVKISQEDVERGELIRVVYPVGDLVRRTSPWADYIESGYRRFNLDELITRVIYPDLWAKNGGYAHIRSEDDILIIEAYEPMHTQIKELLTILRRRG